MKPSTEKKMNLFIEPGSAEWYYERYPGFYNKECYQILEQWHKGVPDSNELCIFPFGEKPKITISKKKSRKRKCQLLVCQEEVKVPLEPFCSVVSEMQETNMNQNGC